MAALDFNMALARGMLPQSETAQKDLLDLAGGRQVFKSEDWWNKAVDEQISSGYRKGEQATAYRTTSGEYKVGQRTISTYTGNPLFGIPSSGGGGGGVSYGVPKDAVITGYTPPPRHTGYVSIFSSGYGRGPTGPTPIYDTKQVEVFGPAGRTDFTAGELSDIERSAERGAAQAKRDTAESKASRKRLARGTGGVVAKALLPGDTPSTGLPALGQTGLGFGTTTLGKGLKL
jgi:hypothetical protein